MKSIIKLFSVYNLSTIRVSSGCLLVVSLFFFQSCSDDDSVVVDSNEKSNLVMDMRSVSESIMNNSLLYVFDDSQNQAFVRKQLNVTRSGDILSTEMNVGTWNFVLLSNSEDISGLITPPAYGAAMRTSPMWETKLTPNGLFLNQTPAELRYAPVPNTTILLNTRTDKTATLNRNVSKIQVVLENHTGFDPVSAGLSTTAYFELLDVPTTLTWEGKLYPNKTQPKVSTKPLRSYMTFDAQEKADPMDFIVPAHRGDDAFTAVGMPTDTTTHHLKLRACMRLGGADFYGKGTIEIPYVPKVNRIVRINVTFRGEPDTELDIKVTVKDWEPYINQDEESEEPH